MIGCPAWLIACVVFPLVVCEAGTGTAALPVDSSTLTGKVMCGYQGWFNCEGESAERGWVN
jgi:hypothetical protein